MEARGKTVWFSGKAGRGLFMVSMFLMIASFYVSSSWAASFPFSDDVENPLSNNWTAVLPWARTTAQYHSSTTSWTDSPSAFYDNNADNALTLATSIDLTSATVPQLSFWYKHQLEEGYDYLYVEYSADDGNTWVALKSYTGYQGSWLREQIALPIASIKIRFHLVTDSIVRMDGFYVDDIVIGEKPAAVILSNPSSPTSSSLTLNWSASGITDFASYRIYRGGASGFSYQEGDLVAEITDIATTAFTDTGLAQRSTYYYILHVVNSLGLFSDTNEVSGITLSGLEYPFQDGMEAGGGNWTPGGNWAVITPDEAHSGNNIWTDDPQGDYQNNSDSSLILTADIDLSSATAPQLVFWHRLSILAGDTASVEVSTDGGETWTALTSYTDTTISTWTRAQLDLTPFSSTPVMIRFRLVTDAAGAAAGWDIDDITLSDKPADVVLSTPVPLSGEDAGKMSLGWTVNTDTSFLAYEVHRATSPGVTLSSTLVATITDQGSTAFTDTGLDPNQVYYYKVFVINGFYAYSGGSNEESESPVGYFFDNMEGGIGDFVAETPWARTTENAYSGSYSWTDSPATTYADNFTASLQFPVNLSGAVMPFLSFWHTYSFEANSDYGFVEVSTDDGTTWTRLHFVTGSQAEWRQDTVDLTVYAGLNIMLRFRIQSDNNGTVSDGWYIDDVSVTESSAAIPYPFVDDMDVETTTHANWVSSSWDRVTDSHSSPFSWTDSPEGNYGKDVRSTLVLAGVIDLSTAVNPQLNFWHKHDFYVNTNWWEPENDYGRVYVSDYYGQSGTWTLVATFGGSQGTWTQEQIDISSFTGLSKVRVKFVIEDNYDTYSTPDLNRQAGGWYIDDVEISDAPGMITLSEPTNVTMHGATLTWTQNSDADFMQYEIYRSASTDVSRSSELIATITDQPTTTYTDTPYYLLRPQQYHYRVYVKDTKGRFSLGSNTVTAVYTVPTISYSFTDDAESGISSWDHSGVWSTTSNDNHTAAGIYSFTDSPNGNYPNDASSSLDTIVDLSLATNPVLTFWHKYVFEDGADFGYVEVSTDQGATWSTLLSVTGQTTAWNQERINLSAYAGSATLWLRFKLTSDATTNFDGWYIDDVSITESTVVNTYPLVDDAEAGVGSWFFDSPWGLTTANAHGGTTSWTDSPGSSYADNSDVSLRTTVNLSGSTMPLLTFWHTYSFETNHDYGFVEVSNDDGTTWTKLFFVTGSTAVWRQVFVNLSEYAGDILSIRFRVTADGNGTIADGWYIDDIAISESTTVISYPFLDDMDDEVATHANWISSSWDLVVDSNSLPNAWHDSPKGNYAKDVSSSLVLAGVLDLSAAVNPQLTFWHKYSFYSNTNWWEPENDYGRVFVSDLYGQSGTWTEVASFNGSQSSWEQVQVDLSSFAGLSKVRIKFVIEDNYDSYSTPDLNRQADGWYIDDLEISDTPGDVTISTPTGVTMQGATLTWTQNTDTDFQQYEIYRSASPGVSLSSELIATITDQLTTTYTDSPYYLLRPTQFYYRIFVHDTTGQYSLGSNEVAAVYTVPSVGYPFSDDAEGGASSWESSGLWSTTNADNHSSAGTYSFTDSPGGNYANNTTSSLDTTIDLSLATNPVLTFWHKYVFEDGADFGYVEVSTDQGATWTTLLSVTGQSTVWNQERINLGAFAGNATLWLRFKLAADATNNFDGWYVDDISISNGLVVNTYPFSDDAEAGVGSWFYDSPWGLTTANAHGGTVSWTDSPGSSYADNADFSLQTTVDLTGTTMPMLSFWHLYSFEANHDYGFVEVSNDGGTSWTKLYFVTGSAAEWRQVLINLSEYAGDVLSLRFRITSDGNGTVADGWYIDDVNVLEATVSIPYPFVDDMDDDVQTRANWISSSWDLSIDSHSIPGSWNDSSEGNYGKDVRSSLVLAGVIDLTGAVNPQLTFWHKYSFYSNTNWWEPENDYGRVYVSDFYGQSGTWVNLASFSGSQGSWEQVQVDLSAFAGLSKVRVKFVIEDNYDTYSTPDLNRQADGWYLDDVEISNAPTDVTISSPTGITLHGTTLTWTQNSDLDFDRYEIYRSTSTGVSLSSELIATIVDPTTTTYTDEPVMILRPGTFSYRIYVVDDTGIYSLGSNEVTPVYTVPVVSVPFNEDAEGDTSSWQTGYTWGITTSQAHGGLASFTDSPDGNYPDNADYSLDTTLNLSGTTNPVLTFWHNYVFEPGVDFGYVQVSTDNGTTWTTLLTVTGQTTIWNQERINLSLYAGTANLWLRFRVVSNESINHDGWYIDDVAIDEGLVVNTFPFSDDVETGIAGWFYNSPWGRTDALSHSGTWSWTDSPGGTYVDNTDTSLVATINLTGSTMPMLTFWHQYSFEPNHDYGFVEVSTNSGASWTKLYFVTGSAANWKEEKVDLTIYAGSQIDLRFRITSDGNGVVSDGWYIDDINIVEAAVTISFPFSDSFDDPAVSNPNWISSSWEMVVDSRSLPNSWHDSPEGNYSKDVGSSLVLAGVIDLTGAVNPQLSFWHKYSFYANTNWWEPENDYGKVYVSEFFGQSGTWTQVAAFGGSQSDWTHTRIDLSDYAGLDSVRIKFVIEDNYDTYSTPDLNRQSDGWYIDDVRIGEKTLITQENTRLAKPNTTVNYAHTLINYTAQADTISLAAISNHGWTVTLYEDTNGDGLLDDTETTVVSDTGSLASGANYFIIAQVQVPWTTSGTLDITTIIATSSNDPFLTDAVTDRTTVDMVSGVTISPDTAGLGVAGAVASIGHTIVNNGNAADDFTLSVASTQGLTVELFHDADGDGVISSTEDTPITTTGSIPSGSSFHLIADLIIPVGAVLGEDLGATITATSSNDILAFDIATDVVTVSELTSLTIGQDKQTMLVGDVHEFLSIGFAGLDEVTFFGTIGWDVSGEIGAIDSFGTFTATAIGLGAVILYDQSGSMPTVSRMVDILGPAGGITQNETGTLFNSDSTVPADGDVQFQAFIVSRPSEVISQEAPGAGYNGGEWQINVGNFSTPWADGDMLHVDFVNITNGEVASIEYALTNGGQSTVVNLAPLSYLFETTATTNVNSFVLLLDIGVTDAEGLVNAIPNATEVAYWDAASQAYIAHTKGLSLFNFQVTPGYPYFVTVTANTVWTPSGTVPTTSFNLITTGSTDVNMVGVPLHMSRVKVADDLCVVIPGCTEVAYWDVASQAYIAHTLGVPLFDFDVLPGLPVFVTVTEESLWP